MFYSYNILFLLSIDYFYLKMDNILNFFSINVNGLKSSKKRIEMFEYFREKISNNGIILLQETH